MSGNKHDDLKAVISDLLKTNLEAATMTFDSFHEAVSKVVPCERADVAVTVTLMEMLGEVQIVKDELGRGRGFALTKENIPSA
jgi:hypothetical protein